MLPTSYQVIWPLGSEEAKTRFFKMTAITDRNDFSYLLSTSLPDASYQVSSQLAFGSEEEAKNKSNGGHLGFLIGIILDIFDLKVTPMPLTKFRVNRPRAVGGVGFLKQIVDVERQTTWRTTGIGRSK